MSEESKFSWHPKELFDANSDYALVVLNTTIIDETRLVRLWNNAKFRVTVDGGTNRWHQIVIRNEVQPIQNPVPDLITGDLDSIKPEVLAYYQKKCQIVKTPDQNFTDFTKALCELAKLDIKTKYIIAFAEHSGRLDQIFGIFETLFHMPNLNVFVISSTSIEWLLRPGLHSIHLPPDFKVDKLHCGLIPLGEPCPGVKTTGLKWNLNGDQALAFGQLVSTSNKFAKSTANILTTKPLLFTIELC